MALSQPSVAALYTLLFSRTIRNPTASASEVCPNKTCHCRCNSAVCVISGSGVGGCTEAVLLQPESIKTPPNKTAIKAVLP